MPNEHPTQPDPWPGHPGGSGRPGPYDHPDPHAHPAQPGPYGAPPGPGPYGASAQPGTPYGPPGHPAPYGPPGQPGPYNGPQDPVPHPFPAYGPPPPPPSAMPSTVRAAQVVIFVVAGLGLLLTFVVGAASGAEAAGRFFSSYLTAWALLVLAFRYGTAGSGVRVASIVLSAVQILFALGATTNGTPGGILPLAGAITVIVLLSQGSAGQWFQRPRATDLPPQPYA
ncbi:hypothetical protein [Streptomyces bullii]|uniref:Integral membrane protein n=1 Tax=Streptomyces bullii TaxID=349910 RepID=A0ABW0USW6_9ACTN